MFTYPAGKTRAGSGARCSTNVQVPCSPCRKYRPVSIRDVGPNQNGDSSSMRISANAIGLPAGWAEEVQATTLALPGNNCEKKLKRGENTMIRASDGLFARERAGY